MSPQNLTLLGNDDKALMTSNALDGWRLVYEYLHILLFWIWLLAQGISLKGRGFMNGCESLTFISEQNVLTIREKLDISSV